MLPPTTSWPPNFFTPRRRPAESRPLRELPPAFLCAISNYLLLLRSRLLSRGLLGCRLVSGGLLGGSFLLRSGLGLRSSSSLLRSFLCFDRSGSGLGLLDLGRGFLLRSGLLLGLRIANRDDPQQSHLLAVTGLPAIVVPAALLEDGDLLALRLGDDLGRDDDLGGLRQAVTLAGEQDVAQGDRVAGVTRQLLDRDLVSGGDAILLAARAHYCEHGLQIRSLSTAVPSGVPA